MRTDPTRKLPRTVWLDGRDWTDVLAFAARSSLAPAEALRQLVRLGVETGSGMRRGNVLDVKEAVERLLRILGRLGPPIVGMPHLLAYWATRESEDRITQAEFIAEFRSNAEVLWKEAIAERETRAGAIEQAGERP